MANRLAMTFVTREIVSSGESRAGRLGIDRGSWLVARSSRLFTPVQLPFQCLHIRNHDPATVHLNELLGLKAAQVARNQLAHRTNLRGQFLIARGQHDLDSAIDGLAFPPRPPRSDERRSEEHT